MWSSTWFTSHLLLWVRTTRGRAADVAADVVSTPTAHVTAFGRPIWRKMIQKKKKNRKKVIFSALGKLTIYSNYSFFVFLHDLFLRENLVFWLKEKNIMHSCQSTQRGFFSTSPGQCFVYLLLLRVSWNSNLSIKPNFRLLFLFWQRCHIFIFLFCQLQTTDDCFIIFQTDR